MFIYIVRAFSIRTALLLYYYRVREMLFSNCRICFTINLSTDDVKYNVNPKTRVGNEFGLFVYLYTLQME